VAVLPYLWYVMMLWYSGFWQRENGDQANPLVKRHRFWMILTLVVLIGVLMMGEMMQRQPLSGGYPTRGINEGPMVGGVPVVLVLFPIYLILCIGLSLDAIRHPAPAEDVIGELARKRARPWLVGASLMLLVVSLVVLGVFLWLFQMIGRDILTLDEVFVIGLFDVVIEAMIAVAVILVGQAVVAYEIFTGQSLPRKGFIRQWHYAVLVALGFGVVIGFVFSTNLRPVYGILLSSLLMTFFLALFSWRTVSERQRTIRSLRPFVTSERMVDQMTGSEGGREVHSAFQALCRDVLDTNRAVLLALGPMSSLAGAPLEYLHGEVNSLPPEEAGRLDSAVEEFSANFHADEPIKQITLGPAREGEWAVPLWSQQGLMGVLLLGGKQDEGLYSREEVEVAQASGERLIDSRVSAEVTRRLIGMQRQRMTETQVLDQRVRRVLHDEVLQDLHTAILKLAGSDIDVEAEGAIELMTGVHAEISRLIRNLPGTSLPDLEGLGLIESLRRLVNDEIGAGFDQVVWEIEPGSETAAKELTKLEREVLYYATREVMRNAARHGRRQGEEQCPLELMVKISGESGLMINVEDNGAGFDDVKPGEFTSKQGLLLHRTMMAVIGGELDVASEVGQYTRVSLSLIK
jgi:signal transduction histidine kinase